MKTSTVIGLALAAAGARAQSVNYTQAYNWKSVRTGASGGFVTGIVFHPKVSGVAYARTDIGGLYKLNSADDSWVALQDYVDDSNWNEHGVDALALDPKNPNIVYIAAGIYTNSWDPYNGKIMKSVDSGKTWTRAPLPFKFGGNMGGRQMGERLAVDPNNSNILYFGARSGNGLWKSTNAGVTWSKVTSYTAVGTHIIQPGDTGQNGDIVGLTFVTFDSTSGTSAGSSRIFVGTADATNTVYMSTNSGATWTAIPGQPTGFLSHAGRFSPTEKALYVSYVDNANTYGGGDGYVYKYYVETGVWKKILDDNGTGFGFGGLDLDAQKNGTVMVATYHQWWPDGNIYRSLDGGDTWTTIWDFDWSGVQPPVKRRYNNWDVSDAQWLPAVTGDKWTGWMMGQLAINPHNSNHFLYGTGATIFGSKQLLNWDSNTPFTLKSLSYGMEQTAVLGLISPPSGPPLISVVGDVGGWTHTNLDVAPTVNHNPFPGTHRSIDYAGSKSNYIIRTADEAGGLAVSTDSGATWHKHASSGTYGGGKAIVSANADFIVWNVGQEVFISLKEGAFSKITSLPPAYYVLAADRKHNGLFYAAEGNNFYVSTDAGTSFNKTATLGYVRLIAANPYRQGDVWVATDNGIWHSINQGSTFAKVGPATEAWHVALGKGATANAYPAIFAAATIQGKKGGHFRSDDGGYTWTLISDAQNGFGTPGNDIYAADPRTYGRVYIGTNGRGIFYGSPKGASTIPVAADAYQQCGGSGYNGPTKCAHGWSCKASNAYYSQCL